MTDRPPLELHEHEKRMTCPFCRVEHELASNIPGSTKAPTDGDLSICIKCGEVSIFSCLVVGGLRKPNTDEMLQFGSNADVIRTRLAWDATMKKRKRDAERAARDKRIDDWLAQRQHR